MDAIIPESIVRTFLIRGSSQILVPQQRLAISLAILILSIEVITLKPNLSNFHLVPPFQNISDILFLCKNRYYF